MELRDKIGVGSPPTTSLRGDVRDIKIVGQTEATSHEAQLVQMVLKKEQTTILYHQRSSKNFVFSRSNQVEKQDLSFI